MKDDATILPNEPKSQIESLIERLIEHGEKCERVLHREAAESLSRLEANRKEWEARFRSIPTEQSQDLRQIIDDAGAEVRATTAHVGGAEVERQFDDSDFVYWLRCNSPGYKGLTEGGDSIDAFHEGYNEGIDAMFAALRKAEPTLPTVQAKAPVEITDEMVDIAYTAFFGLEDQRRTPESRLKRVRAALEAAING